MTPVGFYKVANLQIRPVHGFSRTLPPRKTEVDLVYVFAVTRLSHGLLEHLDWTDVRDPLTASVRRPASERRAAVTPAVPTH
ncbi:MAG: hypothetical protein JWN52_1222 [Actinomycetia bacterium]|nr:hypothetical protein [Actinomycetes bacterium]